MVTSLLDALQDCSIPDVGSSFNVTAKCDNNSKVGARRGIHSSLQYLTIGKFHKFLFFAF